MSDIYPLDLILMPYYISKWDQIIITIVAFCNVHVPIERSGFAISGRKDEIYLKDPRTTKKEEEENR